MFGLFKEITMLKKQSRDCVCHCEELAQVSTGVMMFYVYLSHVFVCHCYTTGSCYLIYAYMYFTRETGFA